MDVFGMVLAFALRPPEKVTRDDGLNIAVIQKRALFDELRENFDAMKDWRLWVMVLSSFPINATLKTDQ